MGLRLVTECHAADDPELSGLLAGIDGLAEGSVVSTRRIVNDLRPPMLEDLGLGEHQAVIVAHRHHDAAADRSDRCGRA